MRTANFLVDESDIFHVSCSRRGKGEFEAPGGAGNRFFIEIPGGGGVPGGGGAGRGREGVCGELGNFLGGEG